MSTVTTRQCCASESGGDAGRLHESGYKKEWKRKI